MAEPLHFDFASPYSCQASGKTDAIFKALGTLSLVGQPGMEKYAVRDFARSARFHGVPCAQPAEFPVSPVAPARAHYWLQRQDGALARRFAHEVFRAVEGRNIADADVVPDPAVKVGSGRTATAAGMSGPAIKDRLPQPGRWLETGGF